MAPRIEGKLDAREFENEGPFGESVGYMALTLPRPYINVKCILHRRNPVFAPGRHDGTSMGNRQPGTFKLKWFYTICIVTTRKGLHPDCLRAVAAIGSRAPG